MKKHLLGALLLIITPAAQATEVTITTESTYTLRHLYIFAEGQDRPVNELEPWESSVTLDLEPGQYHMAATLDSDNGTTLPLGASKTFTVNDTPTTVAYTAAENYVPVRFTVTDDNGRPLEGITIDTGADETSYLCFEYGFQVRTAADGTAETLAAPNKAFTCSTYDGEKHFASLQQRFSTGPEGTDVALSYAGYHRINLTVTGYYVPEWDNPDNFSGTAILRGENQFELEFTAGGTGHTLWAVVPDGQYDLLIRYPHDADGHELVATTPVTVSHADVSQSIDLAGARKVSFAPDNISGEFTLYATSGDRRVALTEGVYPVYLLPGPYELAGAFYDMSTDRRYIFGHPFQVSETTLDVDIVTDLTLYHDVTFDVTTAAGCNGYQADVNGSKVAYAEGLVQSLPAIADGTYSYAMTDVWVNEKRYVLPLTPGGTFTVSGADAVVPVDLTDHRFFTIHYTKDGKEFYFNDMYLTDSEGRRVHVENGGLNGTGFGLRPGTYRISGTLEFDLTGHVNGTLTVPDDCPGELTVDLTDGTTGISPSPTVRFGATVVAGGLKINAATGVVSVSLYDTTGRHILTSQAADGQTVSTTGLPTGTYIVRLRQDATTQSLKFIVP